MLALGIGGIDISAGICTLYERTFFIFSKMTY